MAFYIKVISTYASEGTSIAKIKTITSILTKFFFISINSCYSIIPKLLNGKITTLAIPFT